MIFKFIIFFITFLGVQLGQWWHESRIDWLELNENSQLLLFRDTRRRLALLNLSSGEKVYFSFTYVTLKVN